MWKRSFRGVATDMLGRGYSVRFQAAGTSMVPAILDGETVIARPMDPSEARVGDVLLCDLGPRLVAHRVVRTRRSKTDGKTTYTFDLRGDRPGAGTDRIEGGSLLGRVQSVERSGGSCAIPRTSRRRRARTLALLRRGARALGSAMARSKRWVYWMISRLTLAMFVTVAVQVGSRDAHAAPSDIQLASSANSTINGATTQSFSIDPGTGADRLLLVATSYSSNTEAVSDITFAGQDGISDAYSSAGNGQSVEIWEFDAPPSGSSLVVITYSKSLAAVAGAIALSNAAIDPNSDAAKRSGTVATSSGTGAVRDVIFSILSVNPGVTATAGADQIQQWNSAQGGVLGAASVETGGTANSTWTFTPATSQKFAIGTVDVTPASTPTAILTRTLVASDDGDGTLIRWRASTLGNTLGFRIYRQEPERPGHRGVLLTPELIAGAALFGSEGGSSMGTRDYAWHDRGAHPKQAQYRVEEVDLAGHARWSRAVTAVTGLSGSAGVADSLTLSQQTTAAQVATPASSSLVSQASALLAQGNVQHPLSRAARSVDPGPDEACMDLASRTAVKIRVEREGMVRVPWADLVGAGLDGNTDPRRLRLYADGYEQPLRAVPESGGGAAIEFYGIGRDTLWSAARTYWLTADGFGGGRIGRPSRTKVPADASAGRANDFSFTIERRDRTVYVAALNTADGDNFFGAVVNTAGASQSLTVTHEEPNDPSPATLEVALQGATTAPHDVTVLLNGQLAGTIQFTGQTAAVGTFAVPGDQVLEGANGLTLRASNSDTDVSLLAWTRLTYRHTYIADDDELLLPSPATGVVRIRGFTTDHVRLVDVTDPDDVREVAVRAVPDAGGFTLVSATPLPPRRRLYGFADTRVLGPAAVRANHPSTWHVAGARSELVIVSSGPLLQSTEPLAALRRSQGWSVAMVDEQDLFDEYNCGEKNPGAIKAFLEQSHRSTSTPARYVLLVGDASFDPRNHLGLGDHDHLSTKLLNTSTIQTASDDWFGDFDGDGVPDIGVGRIPAATVAQAEAAVRKLLSYPAHFGGPPATGGGWTTLGLFVADDNVGYDFESEARAAEMLMPSGMRTREFFRSARDPATAESDLIGWINSGAALVNYAGHGSVQLWDGLLQTADVAALTNGAQLPVFVNMTCLNALFQDPRIVSLGTSLLLADNGGAIAVWSSSTSPDATDEDTANRAFVRSLSEGALGDAVIRAKAAVTDPDVRIAETLLGDPSLFGAPTRSHGERGAAATPVSRRAGDEPIAGAAPRLASSCSIDGRLGGRTAPALFFLAYAGALWGRRRRARPPMRDSPEFKGEGVLPADSDVPDPRHRVSVESPDQAL